MSTIAERKKY